MPAVFGILMLTATMAAAEPNVMHYQLQKNCDKLAAQTFHREMADDEGRVDYRAHYNARLNKCFYAETYISPTPVGINKWVYLSDLQENRIYGGVFRCPHMCLLFFMLCGTGRHSQPPRNRHFKPYNKN